MANTSYSQAIWNGGGADSSTVDLAGASPVGLIFPGTFAGTSVTVLVSDSPSGTFVIAKNPAGTNIAFTPTTNSYTGFTSDMAYSFLGARFLRLRSTATEAANTIVKVAIREIS